MLTYDVVVLVPEHMLPPPVDLDSDTLPTEQHPSYPLGDPYHIHHAPHTLQPQGSSQPKLPPRLYAKYAMHSHADGTADPLSAIASGSASAQAAVERRRQGGEDPEEEEEPPASYHIEEGGTVRLAPHLQLRAQTSSVPAAPRWPFKWFGPGPSARPYGSLLRSSNSANSGACGETDVWADFALDTLVPQARADAYTLPATCEHPYASPRRGGAGARRPSDMPRALGGNTAAEDQLWLDEEEEQAAPLPSDDEVDMELSAHELPRPTPPSARRSRRIGRARDSLSVREPRAGGDLFARATARRDTPHFVSAARAQEEREFRRALMRICLRKERSARTKRARRPSPPAHDEPQGDRARKKARGAADAHWVWGVSASLP